MKVLILLVACVAYGNAAICEDVCSPLCKTAAGAAGAAVSGGTAAAVAGAASSVVCSPSCATLCNWGGKAVDWITGLFGKRAINDDGWVTVRTWVSVFPRAFASYDTNKDGLISHREFVNAINAEVRDMATLKAFKLADLNDDDYISPAELRVAPFRFGA